MFCDFFCQIFGKIRQKTVVNPKILLIVTFFIFVTITGTFLRQNCYAKISYTKMFTGKFYAKIVNAKIRFYIKKIVDAENAFFYILFLNDVFQKS